ncbi:MAG: hypothetical protein K9J51_07370 [Desulfotignum sp.]|nr:hypothetical protein [Desulfotignum sp.]
MKAAGDRFRGNVPIRAVVFGGVFLLGAALYWGLVIYPSFQSLSRTRQKIAQKTQVLENQKGLLTVYARAREMTRQQYDMALPLPDSKSLPRTRLIAITDRLSRMAEKNRLDILGNTVHINGVTAESRSIAMTIQLKGHLSDFRSYLVDVVAMESFNTVDGLNIYTDKTHTKYYTIDIRLWLEAQTP